MSKASKSTETGRPSQVSLVTSRNQVTIPAEVRLAVGIGPGTGLSFTTMPDGRIIVRKKSGTLADLRGAALRPSEVQAPSSRRSAKR